MLIRVAGYNAGVQEYLEEGNKSGREFSRDELDHRMIIDGDLDLTRVVYESIPDRGQDRYLTFTLSFKEDDVSPQVLESITSEFKQFLMHAYQRDEFNFYAEAHLPKIKSVLDRKTGELVERKPHIHVVVPRLNLYSGKEANPVDVYKNHEAFFEAFQEYINQKYNLISPRESVRADITDAASVLSRYKGDDFYGKNRAFKQELVKQIIEQGITTRQGFYDLVGQHGETRIRNEGKANEYISVKLPGDAKSTNLKDSIFGDAFVVHRELKKPPLDPSLINERLQAWPQRAREIKYIHKEASPQARKAYWEASPEQRVKLLAAREQKFYQLNRPLDDYRSLTHHQRSPSEATDRGHPGVAYGLQILQRGPVADHGKAREGREPAGAVLLPGDAHLRMGREEPGRDPGLRPAVRGEGRRPGRGGAGGRGPGDPAAVSPPTARGAAAAGTRRGTRPKPGPVGHGFDRFGLPPGVRDGHRVQTLADIERRGQRLFGKADRPAPSAPVPKPAKRPRMPFNPHEVPPYTRNPNHPSDMASLETRARQLFGPATAVGPPRYIQLPSPRPLLAQRSVSSVAAYVRRQHELATLRPADRRVLRRLDSQFHQLRRALYADTRLTRQDKAQFMAVLTFERLKARTDLMTHQPPQETTLMGSAEIRKLIQEPPRKVLGFSISAPEAAPDLEREPEGVRLQAQKLLQALNRRLDSVKSGEPGKDSAQDKEKARERERTLNAKDLYSRKARFSQNVHYLSKHTDKTMFVDTGKAIVMRRTGIDEAGVAVALQLAKERFGSTLSINGTPEFKRLVVEAAAQHGLDIHFTDKDMNQALKDRRAELEIEQDAASIAQADPAPEQEQATPVLDETKMAAAEEVTPAEAQTPAPESNTTPAPTEAVPGDLPETLTGLDAEWRASRGLSEADMLATDVLMEFRAENHVNWLVGYEDHSPEAVALVDACLEDPTYRKTFKHEVEKMYSLARTGPDKDLLDRAFGPAIASVHAVEERLHAAAPVQSVQQASAEPGRVQYEGVLLDHGAAPYQHNEALRDKPLSYFVTLQLDSGKERTLWGVGLESAMADTSFEKGDRVRLIDHGTQPVSVTEAGPDGQSRTIQAERREWACESLSPAHSVQTAGAMAAFTPEQDEAGMQAD